MARRGAREPTRRPSARLDHVVVLPGSAWGHREHWRRLAQELAADTVLLVLPMKGLPLRPVLEQLARRLQADGHGVVAVPEAQLASGKAVPMQHALLT